MTAPDRRVSRIGMTQAAQLDLNPQLQGATDPRPADQDDTLIRALIHLPAGIASLEHMLGRVLRTIQEALAPQVWANAADVSNIAAVSFGAGVALPVFTGYTNGAAVRLRNILIGSSVASIVQLGVTELKSGGDFISPTANVVRIVGTVRTTATALSTWFPGEILLKQGESLVLIAAGATSFDFSTDYRYLPQG